MSNLRLIGRLDIKGPNLIKSVQFEGLRVMGDPNKFAIEYYESGIDELIFIDMVATLYNRNTLNEIIKKAAQDIFVPITVGGGIRTIGDAREMFRSGADKIAINTAAVKEPKLISNLANEFGSQSVVVSIEAKRKASKKWEVFTNNGREPTGIDVVEWSEICVELGAGEILLTSVDNEGTKKGFDLELVNAVSSVVDTPIIASGGMGVPEHASKLIEKTQIGALAMGRILHYKDYDLRDIRNHLGECGFKVRKFDSI
jgi:cyclase